MIDHSSASRIRLRPRSDVVHVSRGRTVLGLDCEGIIRPGSPRLGLYSPWSLTAACGERVKGAITSLLSAK